MAKTSTIKYEVESCQGFVLDAHGHPAFQWVRIDTLSTHLESCILTFLCPL